MNTIPHPKTPEEIREMKRRAKANFGKSEAELWAEIAPDLFPSFAKGGVPLMDAPL